MNVNKESIDYQAGFKDGLNTAMNYIIKSANEHKKLFKETYELIKKG
jgi:hypothetical protein